MHKIPPLPKGKSVIDLFTDFMHYLQQCAKTYIKDTHAGGKLSGLQLNTGLTMCMTPRFPDPVS